MYRQHARSKKVCKAATELAVLWASSRVHVDNDAGRIQQEGVTRQPGRTSKHRTLEVEQCRSSRLNKLVGEITVEMSNDASADEPAKGVNRDRVECACHCGLVFTLMADRASCTEHTNNNNNISQCRQIRLRGITTTQRARLQCDTMQLHVLHQNRHDGEKFIKRYFCSTCGVHCWMEGAFPLNGNMIPLFSVNLSTVDQPQPGVDLSQVKLRYFNMLGKGFDNPDPTLHDAPCKGGLP
ncbi:uncharacterized protein K489DRAFT_401008 [Dissoconium aciculare CBS 342.82]|uniref:CENP-V/GFA domain-containing protein n=1 Tax=Dissoconium aciculare CBS 342.82 TaxID=1314786 RepID=A0A6J3M6T8_9PEZI|nr:uncharacterized protein K489DRAFT_401008 [Dissoconium aciculare CBS 342.82]KAF1823730.1 hypothetical protein K489DRAFT_401008 [Dissoconium aciculare CBS 342.82]